MGTMMAAVNNKVIFTDFGLIFMSQQLLTLIYVTDFGLIFMSQQLLTLIYVTNYFHQCFQIASWFDYQCTIKSQQKLNTCTCVQFSLATETQYMCTI